MDCLGSRLSTQFTLQDTSNPPVETQNNITPMMVDDATNTFDGQSIHKRHATTVPPEQLLSQEISKVAKYLSELAGSAKSINPNIQTQLTGISTQLQKIAPLALQPFSNSLEHQPDVIKYLQLMKQVQSEITEHSNLATYNDLFQAYQHQLTQTLISSPDNQKRIARNPEYSPKLYNPDTTEGKFVEAKMKTLSDYFSSNKLHDVDGLGIYGNCGIMAHKLYASIKKSKPEKHIFLVHLMPDQGGDHQFVVVSNTAYLNDPENLVLDPWTNIIFKSEDNSTYLYNPTNDALALSIPDDKLKSSFLGEDNFEPDRECSNKSLAYKLAAFNPDVGIILYDGLRCNTGAAKARSDMKLPNSGPHIVISIREDGSLADIVVTGDEEKKLNKFGILVLAWPAKNQNHLVHFSQTYTENALNGEYCRLNFIRNLLRQLINLPSGYGDEAVKASAQHAIQQLREKLKTASDSVALIDNDEFIYLTNIILKLSSQEVVNSYFDNFDPPVKQLFEYCSDRLNHPAFIQKSVSLHLLSTQWIQQAVDIIELYLKSSFNAYSNIKYVCRYIKNMEKPLKLCHQALSAYSRKLKIDLSKQLSELNEQIKELSNSPENKARKNVDAVLNKYRELAACLTKQDPVKHPSWTGFELWLFKDI